MLSTCIWVAFGMDVDQNSKIKLEDTNMIVNEDVLYQWLFLVPLIGGRQHIITQMAIYKWYILPFA